MKFAYNPKFLSILLIILISIPALRSLTQKGFYSSHDGETHTARIASYYKAASDGQIPPRIADTLYNGLGSPIFVYIYPTPYALGSLIHYIGFSYSSSFKILMALGFIFSGIFSYLWLRSFFQNEKAALLGAIYYIWAPYRFSLIYVRASVSEILAYTFLPLSLFCLTKLSQRNNLKWTALSAISISLILLSQNLVALISLPILGLYVLLLYLFNKSLKYLLYSLFASIWAFTIASFTYLPTLFEREYIRLDEIIRIAYPDHFVSLKQLIYSPWGYGFDLPGTLNDQMSFQLGLAHILIVFTLLTILIYSIIFSKIKIYNFHLILFNKPAKKEITLSVYFLTLFILSIFLMLDSKPTLYIWQNIKHLSIIDIPWRLAGITILSISFITALTAKIIKPNILIVFFVLAVLIANRNHLRINQSILYDDNHFQNYTGTATQYNEFTPKWRQTTRVPIGFDINSPIDTISGETENLIISKKSNEIIFKSNVKSDSAQIRINKFYFPNWQVSVNGKNLKPFENLTITDSSNTLLEKEKDTSGLMQIDLKKGQSEIIASFNQTPLRNISNLLSLFSLVLALAVILKYVKT